MDLARHIHLPLQIDFMATSSYGASTKTSGVVRILKDLDEPVVDKHLLVVEDIVDTGLTLKYILRNLATRRPASLRVCALLVKDKRRPVDVRCDYIGFQIPDRFVVGYGLDYGERYRNLPYVGVLKPSVYAVANVREPREPPNNPLPHGRGTGNECLQPTAFSPAESR